MRDTLVYQNFLGLVGAQCSGPKTIALEWVQKQDDMFTFVEEGATGLSWLSRKEGPMREEQETGLLAGRRRRGGRTAASLLVSLRE